MAKAHDGARLSKHRSQRRRVRDDDHERNTTLIDRRTASSKPPRAEGRLKVVTSDSSVEIKDFSGEYEVWNDLAMHRSGVDLGQRHSAGRDFGFLEPQRPT